MRFSKNKFAFVIHHSYFSGVHNIAEDCNLYSSHLLLDRPFRIYLSRIYFYLYGMPFVTYHRVITFARRNMP